MPNRTLSGAPHVAPPPALTTEPHRTGALPRPNAGQRESTVPEDSPRSAVLHMTAIDRDPAGVTLDGPLLTAEDVASLLAVPRSSVHEYARRRTDPLPSLLIGRHRRFDRRTLERWLAAQATLAR